MPIGSVSFVQPSTAYAGPTSARSATDAALDVLQRQADDRAQLEYLRQHLLALEDALARIREHWRRGDEALPANAARAVSRAVLSEPGAETLALATLDGFADVTAGNLTVNGADVAFDPATDSLADLIDHVNAAGTGATAALDATGLRLEITADDPADELVLGDGGTGLLDALGITAGTYAPTAAGRSPGMSWSRAGTVAEALGDAIAAVNAIFTPTAPGGEPASYLVRARGDLQSAVEEFFAADKTELARDVNFTQDFAGEAGDVLSFTARSQRLLVRALRNRPAAAQTLLFGAAGEGADGLVGRLEFRVGLIRKRLETTFAQRGIDFDVYA